MKLGVQTALVCATVHVLLLCCAVPNIEVTAISTDPSHEVIRHVDSTVHRFRRQTRNNSNRGIFSLIYDYIVETRDDAMRAYREIQDLVSKTIVPKPKGLQLNTTDPDLARERPDNETVTTTEASFLLTQDEFYRLLRRNYRGLVKLFNKESRKALQDSNQNVRVLRKQLQDVVRPYVQPANATEKPET